MYCSDANSTAFQFPLHDGKLLQTKAGPAVEVPLVRSAAQRHTGSLLRLRKGLLLGGRVGARVASALLLLLLGCAAGLPSPTR